MERIAYNIAGAAKAASVTEQTITNAVKARQLIARRVDDKAVILATDIQAWLATCRDWNA